MNGSSSLEIRIASRTGIEVTVFGLGAGGGSRIGNKDGGAERVLAAAAQLGIGYIDTAEGYGTEGVIGSCLPLWMRPPVLSSKLSYLHKDGSWKTESEIEESLKGTLGRLGIPRLDIYFVHGVLPEDYPRVRRLVLPLLVKYKEQGLVRAVGVSEMFNQDPRHRMLEEAVADGCWDFVMTGVNLLNRSALERVVPGAVAAETGVMAMFVVRNALRSWERLTDYLWSLNWLNGERERRLKELREICGCSLPSVAYRYIRDLPGVLSVLGGTSSPDHLRENVAAMCTPPLSWSQRNLIDDLFSDLPLCTGQ